MPTRADFLAEHRELQAALDALRVLAARPSRDERAWVVDLAGALRDLLPRLFAHFASEERSGLFEEIGERGPENLSAARRLREDHEHLRFRLERLHEDALAWPVPGGPRAFAARVREVLDALVEHEAFENEVLVRSLDASLAAAD